jgi:hypothetical protein
LATFVIALHLRWLQAPNEAEPSAHTGGTGRKLIAALAASAATLALAGPAVANQAATSSADLANCSTACARILADSNEVAVEGITLDHSGFEIS